MDKSAKLGKYSLVAEIARGGMGIVYLAQAAGRHGFKKLVVLKQLKPELAEDEKFREMFLDEARLAARLNHRNIVQTLEVDEEDEQFFFVMEYLEGRTLHAASLLKKAKALPQTATLWILCDVLAGLHYAHELLDFDGKPLGVVHRDVSPRNVFLTYDGQVKLLDFGVAKASGRGQETEAGELKGRIPYMCPDHVREKHIDRRADVFSVGVILREALTGRRLWEGANEVEILSRLLAMEVPPIPEGVELPDEAREIINKSLAPNREDRYRTAHEMRTALESYVSRLDKTGATAKFGEALALAFTEHRAQLKELIEDHQRDPLASLPSLPDYGSTPVGTGGVSSGRMSAAAGSSPGSSAGSGSRSSGSLPTSDSRPSGSRPSGRQTPSSMPAAVATSTAPGPLPSIAPGLSPSTAPEPTQTVTKDYSIPPPPPKSRAGMWVAIGMGFVALVAGLTVVIRSLDDEPATSKTKDPGPSQPEPTERRRSPFAPVPSASNSAEPDTRLEVTVRASPPVAHLWIDDVAYGEGPHTVRFEKDSRHTIRAMAPGYVPKTETISVSSMMSVNILLEKEAGAPKPHGRPGGGGAAAPGNDAPPPEARVPDAGRSNDLN